MPKTVVTRIDRNLARRLREARRETGLSTRDVVKQLPKRLAVSHTMLARYENGEVMPAIDVLAGLADIYKRTLNWFMESRECLTGFRYRNLPSRVPIGAQRLFEATASKWSDAYMNLGKFLGTTRKARRLSDRGGMSPQQLADAVRKKHLNLDEDQPIQNIVSVLESFAAWAIEVKADFQLDGAMAQHGDDLVVMLNPDVANERIRMNAAHDLAHIVYEATETDQNIEEIAYAFATSLLLPRSQLEAAFQGKSFLKLIQYKERFGVSLVAMVHMAEQEKIINSTTSRWLWGEIARRGWRSHEPGYVWRDRAIQFETMLESAIQTKSITWLEAESITGIREDDLRQRIADIMFSKQPESKGSEATPDTLSLAAFRVAD